MSTKEEILSGLVLSIGSQIKKRVLCKDDQFSEISFRDLELIEFIGKNKKTMSEIANELNLTAGTVTSLIDKLEENNILKRERDNLIDRRKIFISLDKKGENIFLDHSKIKLEIINIMIENFSEEEKDFFIKIMKKVDANLNN